MKKVAFLTIVFAFLMMFACIAPALGKNLNYPPGVEIVYYVDAGGQADIPILAPLPAGYPGSTTDMRLSFRHVEVPNAGLSFSGLLVSLRIKLTGATEYSWQPFAYITTNADEEEFMANVWSGTFINFDASLVGLPDSCDTYNVKVVSEDMLQVDRHGNSVTVKLNTPQQIKRPAPALYFTLPAFSLDLTKIDNAGSNQYSMTVEYNSWTGASGYTYVSESMGFAANGVFTCLGSPSLNTGPVTNAVVIMKGTQAYYPPP